MHFIRSILSCWMVLNIKRRTEREKLRDACHSMLVYRLIKQLIYHSNIKACKLYENGSIILWHGMFKTINWKKIIENFPTLNPTLLIDFCTYSLVSKERQIFFLFFSCDKHESLFFIRWIQWNFLSILYWMATFWHPWLCWFHHTPNRTTDKMLSIIDIERTCYALKPIK